MAKPLVSLIIAVALLACSSQNVSQEDIEETAATLATEVLDFYRAEVKRLGIAPEQEIEIVFSFHAPSESRAEELAALLRTQTSHEITVSWFKEPETGWFVVGETAPMPAESPIHPTEIQQLTLMGLKYGCEMRAWRPVNENAV